MNSQLRYEPETGLLFWKVRKRGRKMNRPVGVENTNGYLQIRIDRARVTSHRVIWLLSTGKWPNNEIDHINRKRTDNRLKNLREATRSENLRNATISKRNTSGVIGVSFRKRERKWQGRMMVEGIEMFLGYFRNFNDAKKARLDAEKKYFKEFAPKT